SAIEGKVKEPHVIHEDQCIRCGLCMEKCKFDAIYNSDAPVPEYVAPEPKKEEPKPAPAAAPAASEAVADVTPAAAAPQEKIEGKYSIDPEKCKGCTACAKVCPAEAISGEVKQPHVIDQEACLGCGACAEKCKFDAISQN
ncbi:MAG: 4Fe-4S binding protein, partial [Clostridiales bacterium]|nr:4Fe-4S binding protein [Clostridiales bacterium]